VQYNPLTTGLSWRPYWKCACNLPDSVLKSKISVPENTSVRCRNIRISGLSEVGLKNFAVLIRCRIGDFEAGSEDYCVVEIPGRLFI